MSELRSELERRRALLVSIPTGSPNMKNRSSSRNWRSSILITTFGITVPAICSTSISRTSTQDTMFVGASSSSAMRCIAQTRPQSRADWRDGVRQRRRRDERERRVRSGPRLRRDRGLCGPPTRRARRRHSRSASACRGDRFRGIRGRSVWDADPSIKGSAKEFPPKLLLDAKFRDGYSRFARYGLSFDSWLFHPQIPELANLAAKFPDTTVILDHIGAPLGIGGYAVSRTKC